MSPPHLKVEELVYDLHLREWQVWTLPLGIRPRTHIVRPVPLRQPAQLSALEPARPNGRSAPETGTLEPLASGFGTDPTVDSDLDLLALAPGGRGTPLRDRQGASSAAFGLPLRWAEHVRHPAFRALGLVLRLLRPIASRPAPPSGLLGPGVASVVGLLPVLARSVCVDDPSGGSAAAAGGATVGRLVQLLNDPALGPVTPENIHHERVRALYLALLLQDAPALADALREAGLVAGVAR